MAEQASGKPEKRWELLALVAVLAATAALFAMGRTLWCKCGTSVPWSFEVASMHNSQHLLDPYTFTHVLHGVAYCGLLGLLAHRLGPRLRLSLAVALEAAWEVLENTPWIIGKYRAETISLDYFGDSVANSLSDVLACTLGFLAARSLPRWASIAGFLAVEALLLLWIKDCLTLNVVMLVCPIPAVREWQMGQ